MELHRLQDLNKQGGMNMARTDKGKSKPRWNDADDEKLVTLRQTKLRSWKQIGKALKRTPSACAQRYSNMQKGKVPMPVITMPVISEPTEEKKQVKSSQLTMLRDENADLKYDLQEAKEQNELLRAEIERLKNTLHVVGHVVDESLR
jgi:predicted RNase H-like nuclease (RuvC/YqgF family)